MREADLRKAKLWETIARNANLEESKLSGASLFRADLSGACLKKADLRGHLLHVAWERIRIGKLTLPRLAAFPPTDLAEANLESANVTKVRFNRWAEYCGIRVANCYGSPRFRRFAQDQEFIEEWRRSRWRAPVYWIWLVLTDCGRSLPLWIMWCVVAVCGFAWKYLLMGPDAFDNPYLVTWDWTIALYYSLATFASAGYLGIAPSTQEAAGWVATEVAAGYVMLAALISILITHLARRS